MAKFSDLKPTPKSIEIEVPFTVMRKIGNEKYEVVVGTIKGVPSITKTLEHNVSLVVGRESAAKAMRKQVDVALRAIGTTIDV